MERQAERRTHNWCAQPNAHPTASPTLTLPPSLPLPHSQVVYGVFLLFCPIGEAVSQTVQTYLPGYTVKRPPRANGKPWRTLTFGRVSLNKKNVQVYYAALLSVWLVFPCFFFFAGCLLFSRVCNSSIIVS